MESSQQTQVQQPRQPIILLPSKHVPQSLADSIVDLKDFTLRIINGYRNIIHLSQQSSPQWALTPNQDYCGQAFCYLLKPTVNKDDLVKTQLASGHVIHSASQDMFVVQSVTGFTPNTLTLTSQQLTKLIEQISESKASKKVAINLVKNAFESFDVYSKAAGQLVQKIQQQLESELEEKIPIVSEALRLQENVKKLQGEMIGRVPKCNKETGQWDEGETVDIKLIAE